MGNSLTSRELQAFAEELKKEAFVSPAAIGAGLKAAPKFLLGGALKHTKGFAGDLQEAAMRVVKPGQGLRKGWKEMSPRGAMSNMDEAAKADYLKPGRMFSPGKHLAEDPGKQNLLNIMRGSTGKPDAVRLGLGMAGPRSNRFKQLAEELSRRGWTGRGDVTKYLPVGMKGVTAGFGGMGAHDALTAPSPTRTGSGGAWEKGLGELAGTGAFIAGAGLGMVPAAGLWALLNKGGTSLGRVVDRMRAGAPLGEAIEAPTPEEAQSQLHNIYKYYG